LKRDPNAPCYTDLALSPVVEDGSASGESREQPERTSTLIDIR
jgi:hypothetical protein